MLEIAFSDSVAGSLKYAIGMKTGQVVGAGAVAVICDDPEEKERILAKMQKPKTCQGGEIPGRSSDVVSLHLQLDFGDLSALEADPEARRPALDRLFGRYEGVAEDLIGAAKKALSRIAEADELRLWIGEQDACDITAAFWLCHLLRGKNVKMSAVYLPALAQRGGEILRFSGAADYEPESLSLQAANTAAITPEMRRYMAARWCKIKEENAPLRAMVNGMVAGVPENVYDTVLRACVPEGECALGRIIGRALGSVRAVGDNILYLRARSWIDEGILEEISPAREDNPYSAVVRRGPEW